MKKGTKKGWWFVMMWDVNQVHGNRQSLPPSSPVQRVPSRGTNPALRNAGVSQKTPLFSMLACHVPRQMWKA